MRVVYHPDLLTHVIDFSDHIPLQEEVNRHIAKAIANDIDRKIRNTLIGLGWTPPGEEMTDVSRT